MPRRPAVWVTLALSVVALAAEWRFRVGENVRIATHSAVFVGTVKGVDAETVRLLDEQSRTESAVRLQSIEGVSRHLKLDGAADVHPASPMPQPKRHIVYIHGICKHAPGYSDPWWIAMKPFVPSVGENNRHEVCWSDIIEPEVSTADIGPDDPVTLELKDFLEDRGLRQRMDDSADSELEPADVISLVPDRGCLRYFTKYLKEPKIRGRVQDRFMAVVRPLLMEGAEIEVISHSWGTVVAYESLCRLENAEQIRGTVANFFTVGSALSIGPVKRRLESAARDGHRPSFVKRWVNLNARFDVVGGQLKGRPFAVDEERLGLPAVGCSRLNVSCAHSSYFSKSNAAVNRDIFGYFIEK